MTDRYVVNVGNTKERLRTVRCPIPGCGAQYGVDYRQFASHLRTHDADELGDDPTPISAPTDRRVATDGGVIEPSTDTDLEVFVPKHAKKRVYHTDRGCRYLPDDNEDVQHWPLETAESWGLRECKCCQDDEKRHPRDEPTLAQRVNCNHGGGDGD
ncbi:hypothetical protein [Natronobacterium gregoryi]|uniref:C2H2-type domain-containing protein n=2 Tax=Natronobacterium gregoryi TaxID=44930 RepID=L0AGQ0_NATGS|nr:hypothetical protein [Natronobacterium gregoryi]AFZ73078.1 hypothetical protein Natgr_1893 [Natronobacterium gregoryi SP2]ELY70821.1 hypothetical protein C490_06007 [Natronobacterium gregoryi SP2]PLK20401.1 hypothetical protein CYV19_09750 [Natronobacterium gregoryi SP2]SFI61773.1 hypothetical protein SAMN05443661_102188 [Natronobacterium gregoryi]